MENFKHLSKVLTLKILLAYSVRRHGSVMVSSTRRFHENIITRDNFLERLSNESSLLLLPCFFYQNNIFRLFTPYNFFFENFRREYDLNIFINLCYE